MPDVEQLRSIVCHDLDPDFVEALAIDVAWEYNELYEELASDPSLSDEMRSEEFGRRRGFNVARSLSRIANVFKIPFERRKLQCNGQNKVLVQAGRVVLIQEPVLTLTDKPKATDYKRQLAKVHGIVRQLELDLGDRPYVVRDWSGCVLGVLLHGAAGPRFTKAHRTLGGLLLAVADASYSEWILRLDLHEVALFGRGEATTYGSPDATPNEAPVQADDVVVTRKKKVSKGAS